MAQKVSSVSDLLHRVASSCLSHRFPGSRALDDDFSDIDCFSDAPERDLAEGKEASIARVIAAEKEEEEAEEERLRMWEEQKEEGKTAAGLEKLMEMEVLMAQVFETVSAVKRAYRSLQQAQCPWDPDKMRNADTMVVSELRKLEKYRDHFRRGGTKNVKTVIPLEPSLKDAVAPYEAALDDLKKEIKVKDAELESLREKIKSADMHGGFSARKGRNHSSKRLGFSTETGRLQGGPVPEIFELCMDQVKSSFKSFTSHLLMLMRAARWDISSLIGSLTTNKTTTPPPIQHAKYVLESYVTNRLFQGFEHESFYLDGSLASLLDPAAFRRGSFTQFHDMRAMDPSEMLGVLPTCQFGQFAAKKYLSLFPPKMEESLFGHTEQQQQVLARTHPRTEFYKEFLRAAKAVWMLHLLAFSLDPVPSRFEVRSGVQFQPEFMESVVRFASGHLPNGFVVGFPVSPGFRLGNGSMVRARVYLVSAVP
ncbi:hypothetical protein LUZ60_011612 [Juncus effusus]|nr:hypothetical protein LUZ60_011612 [Juncus effusus]